MSNFAMHEGSWTFWSNWSPCSKSCGGGTTTRTRTCLPQNAGISAIKLFLPYFAIGK
jgi:Thrombospondin type 1 domain